MEYDLLCQVGGEGTDTAVFAPTRAAPGPITRTGNIVSVGANTSLIDVDFTDFTDGRIATATPALAALLTLATPTVEGKEGTNATVDFVVSLATDTTIAFATRDGSATGGSDYQARSGTVTIAAGAKEAVISIAMVNDSIAEQAEGFHLDLSVGGSARFRGNTTTSTAAALIGDDDVSPNLQLTGEDASIMDGGPGQPTVRTISVERVGDVTGATTVTYAVTRRGPRPRRRQVSSAGCCRDRSPSPRARLSRPSRALSRPTRSTRPTRPSR